MSLRYALLGFLSTTPASGYTLGRKFADGAGAMWEALPSQIYPELAKLEKLGWIRGETDESDRLNRRTYRVTAAGRRALQAWVEADEAEHAAVRDAERVRFLFLDRSEPAVIRQHVERYRAHYEARLAHWLHDRDTIADGTHERQRDRLADCPPAEQGFVTGMKWFAFDGLVRRAQMEIRWASDILAWLDAAGGTKQDAALPFAGKVARTASVRGRRQPAVPRPGAVAKSAPTTDQRSDPRTASRRKSTTPRAGEAYTKRRHP
jgi:DNA-binding PadR family transcriptional regulator